MPVQGQKTGRRDTNQLGEKKPARDVDDDGLTVDPPRKSRSQLAISSFLLLLWILFLAWIAVTH